MKQKIPKAIYSKEFREQAVKQATEEGLSTMGSSQYLTFPPSTLANWVIVLHTGKLGEIG